jgi:hypothetical protein
LDTLDFLDFVVLCLNVAMVIFNGYFCRRSFAKDITEISRSISPDSSLKST